MKFSRMLVCLAAWQFAVATGFAAVLAPAAGLLPSSSVAPAAPAAPARQLGKPIAGPAKAPAPALATTATDIRDIRGPISIPYGWLWAAYVAGGMVLAAALYGAWRWYSAQPPARSKQPAEIALERLEQARALMTPDRAREYSFAVSEITREYIEARFHERAARRTTEEFLHDLVARTGTPLSQHRVPLEDFLQYCDLAKFARWQLSPADMASMYESARTFILATRPQSAAVPPAMAPSLHGSDAHAAEPAFTPARS
jgi:hypothetical protein